jgi:hypothetical protein
MAEDHMKYMPHHPKPKFGDKGMPSTKDTMLRKRNEATSDSAPEGGAGMSNNYGSYEGK